ncbi:unnamed protein product [Symbiodinium pilosum]|uniref:Uncharacterized protein n=1 Tax=Symbiodinium pilosum TaxID=2952 RepID=A0A812M7I1_SYMPI|nr:unnamed protein product [Symbiodinium pilosum]
MEPAVFVNIARNLVESALLMHCPSMDQIQAEAISAGSFWAHAVSDAARPEFLRRNERLMAQLVKRDLPHWLESDWAGHADAFRLRPLLEHLKATCIDLRLAYQPAFLEDLQTFHLWNGATQELADLVQQAARLASKGTTAGVSDTAFGGTEMLTPKLRITQRHAEVHCLLQLPRLADANLKQMLIVEIADVGPGLGWAEPCSRGCVQLLTKYGLSPIFFTDGRGSLVKRHLRSDPGLDVPYKTYARRLSDDRISERAWLDISQKAALEQKGCQQIIEYHAIREHAESCPYIPALLEL